MSDKIDYNSDTDPRVVSASDRADRIVDEWMGNDWGAPELHSLIATAIIDVHQEYAALRAALAAQAAEVAALREALAGLFDTEAAGPSAWEAARLHARELLATPSPRAEALLLAARAVVAEAEARAAIYEALRHERVALLRALVAHDAIERLLDEAARALREAGL